MEQLLQNQVGIGFVVVWLLQKAKTASWFPLVNAGTDKFNRFLSALAAAAATIGITWQYDPTGGVLTVSGLTLASVGSFLMTFISQGAIQEGLYRGLFKPAAKVAI